MTGISLYGPKDPKIAAAVDRLAVERGMRVAEIEAIILAALLQRLSKEPDR